MERPILPVSRIYPSIQNTIASYHIDMINDVENAILQNAIVVVGMKQNPFPKKATKLLNEKNMPFKYLEYGSYFSKWRERSALKFWTGWPTFPMIFIKGTLIGGYSDLEKLVNSGEIQKLIK